MKKNKIIPILFGIYCSSLIIQNILATKSIDVFMFTVTTGILISPIVFIINDIVSELYGYKTAKKMVILSFVMNFIGVLLFQLAILIPSSDVYFNQQSFKTILGTTFRITCASFLAYLTGSLINSKIMTKLKKKYEKLLFFRAISSTVFGQLLDNAIFAVGAFLFVMPFENIISMIIGGTLFEILYEIIFYPITKKCIKKLK